MNRHARTRAEKEPTNMKNSGRIHSTNTLAAANTAAQNAPPTDAAKKGATAKKTAPNGRGARKNGTKKKATMNKAASAPAQAPKTAGKGAVILAMIGQPKGATLTEIMNAADWQAHSVRGFISTARKKLVVKIESTKNETGERRYTIAK
jgi:Protein of unknown function (DUF3489)